MNEKELIETLCAYLGTGRLDNGFLLPALKELGEKSGARPSSAELLEALERRPGPAFESLANHLKSRRRVEAARCLQRKKNGAPLDEFRGLLGDLPLNAPPGWLNVMAGVKGLRGALEGGSFPGAGRVVNPDALIETLAATAPALKPALEQIQSSLRSSAEGLKRQAADHLNGGPSIFPLELDEEAAETVLEEAFAKADAPERKRRVLDAACGWPTSWMAGLIRKLGADPALRDRAALLLTLRFDEPSIVDWSGWDSWLARVAEQDEVALNAYRALAAEAPAELLLLWARDRADCPAEAREALELHCRDKAVSRPKPAAPSPVAAAPLPKKAALLPRAPVKAAAPQKPPEPAGPSLWDEHLLPFFAGNWPMLAGIAMVVVGSSLLAYYTWDKHWFVRYTVLPVLLAAFTSALGRIGDWIEKRDPALKGTADMLRGASVALLPANFMAVALLARDPQVTHKEILLPVFTLLYIAAAGRGLRRWCAAVHEPLGRSLAPALLGLNALVLLGPFLLTYAPQTALRLLLGAGFHAGFLLTAWTIARFVKDELTPKLSEEGRVPWFLGVTLASTYIQVFLWVHGYLRYLPPAHAYACLVVVAGGLVLFSEQSSRGSGEGAKVYGKESFIGYAAILLGLFMGAAHPEVRTLSLALAGAIWMAQAVFRRELLHAWIAFTLLALSGGSVGLWDGFPRPQLPVLTLGLAAAMGGLGRGARRWWDEFVQVGARMQAAVLHVTAVLAVLVQWHYRSAPLATAAVLLAAAALFAWRAHRDQKLVYVHTGMTVLAAALPYLGFADMLGRTLQGNTVVFGLSLLSLFWLVLQRARPTPMIRGGRSTVLLIYGALAMTAMFLRVSFEQGRPENVLAGPAAMSLAGPLLMAAALVFAAYYSRSLLPIGMASLMVIILLPQLRREITEHLPFIHWGSGLMSALSAVALTWSCFRLRASPALANLDEGDRFGGYAPFPLRRPDHTLFTWPLLASALFLLVKVDLWVVATQVAAGGVHLKTAAALIAAGVAWTLRAIYYRDELPGARTYVHFGWLSGVAGLAFGYYDQAVDPRWHGAVLLCVGALNALYLGYRYGLEPDRPWAGALLAAPMRAVLRLASGGVALAALAALFGGGEVRPMLPLLAFSSVQLAWFGLTDGDMSYGTLLFFQTWAALLSWAAPGMQPLFDRISIAGCLQPTLLYFLGIQAVQLALEFQREAEARLRALVAPLFFWCALGAFFAGIHGVFDGVVERAFTFAQQGLLLAVVLSAARAQGCGPLALLALLLGYLDVCFGALSGAGGGRARVDFLLCPWRFSAFALAMTVLAAGGRLAFDRWPRFIKGPYGHGFFDLPARPWVFLPAMLFAAYAVMIHGLTPDFRHAAAQLWTPYLAAAAFAVVGLSWRRAEPFAVAALLLGLGNVHATRFYLGEILRARGLTENHLFCLGAAATFGQFRLARRFAASDAVAVFLNRAALLAAGFVLALLTSTYFIHPDLEAMSNTRFLLSGAMAWLAGRCFQRAAREPDPGEAPYAAFFEGVYHYGVTTALWCFALLIPWFLNPYAAFPALGLPVLYFYARAELANGGGEALVARWRNTATALSFFLFALYAFRGAFQMVLFPQAALGVEHYHFNAPFVMLLALVMFRLQGLGGTPWLGFYGGLAMMVGSYFLLTRLPGLSPFDYPIPAAWCAFGLGHFWMLFSAHPSPPRTFLQRIGNVDDAQWEAHRGSWGVFLLAATQASLAWGLTDQAAHPYLVAPLFLGGASLLAHQAYIRGSVPLYIFAAFEALIALHADFFVTSWLPKDQVVWALLAIWAGLVAASEFRPEGGIRKGIGAIASSLSVVVLAHVFYHEPDTSDGLWAFAAGSLLAALTPRPERKAASQLESMAGGLLLLVPVWLVHFSQARGSPPWPWLSTTAAVLATGLFARWVQQEFYAPYSGWERNPPRLFDQTLATLGAQGDDLASVALYFVFVLTAVVQATHYGSAFAVRDLALMLGLYGVSAYAWFEEGRLRQTMPPYFMLQFCVIGFFAVIRRQLMLTLGWWNYEYDVWASLLVSFSLAGAKQILPLGPPASRIPLLGTLLAMPVAVMAWVLIHGLGTDTVLLVVGLYSLMFAYMGKDDRESPYHIVAMGGFVAFVLIVFWTKLELRALSAYVIPVGLGTLILLQMFRDKVSPVVRNEIRAVTLLAMLGSAGYYALMDDRYPLYFHMTMLVVSVLAMSVGSLFRTRVYVLLGFSGLLTDLAALLYKLLVHMDRSSRMTLIGTQVLVFGTVLIVGAIYYKTNQEKLNETFERWRGRLTAWE